MFSKLKTIVLTAGLLAAVSGPGSPTLAADGRLQVVASTTFFADLVKKVGGNHVEVKSVASPKFNVHFIQPKPSDVRNVSKADLFVFAGLDLEAWADPLLEAAGRPKHFRGGERNLDLSQGIRLLGAPEGPVSRTMGDIHIFGNPHYAMNPENLKIMAESIATKLSTIDPANAGSYRDNLRAFLGRLDTKIIEWKALCAHCAGKEIYSYHKDIDYLALFLGIRVEQYLEPMPGVPPTPRHLRFLEEYARKNSVRAIALPTYFPRETAEVLGRKIGAPVVTVCQHVGEIEGTEDIFNFFDMNIKNISQTLKG